ncbi:F-box protein isoform X1 [Tanacetum coccineum]|uniref:F-box protein isoform X1 n=1 Tax=Tanacetum coccineum TaxID=301880 RepID=A0ABQ5I118_9ASTR
MMAVLTMEGTYNNRYRKLTIEDSLNRICHYPSACRELASIIKQSYSKLPKTSQSLLFQDTLIAIRLLPRMQTQTAVSAANALIQSVESALPKQKKVQAVTEFKKAMIAHKRGSKARQNEQDLVELPQDVIVHIFSFLDLHSLVSALQVCRSWNAASTDNHLWQLMYTVFYNTSHDFDKTYKLYGGLTEEAKSKLSQGNIVCNNSLDWRTTFKKAYDGFSSKKLLTSSRGFCQHCQTIFWVSDMANGTTFRLQCKHHQINPISTQQIVEFIDGEYASSESDSDTDEFVSKLWAYRKRPGSLF